MIIAKNDEEKRSKWWRIVTTTATIVIIVVVAYFMFALFAGNPLEGKWFSKQSNLQLVIHKGGSATLYWPEMGETSNVKLNMKYTIVKDAKTISFQLKDSEVRKTVKMSDGKLTADAIFAEVGALDNTFDYSMNQGELVLTEREYGDTMVFIKE